MSRKSVTGSRSIKTFESAKIVQLKCFGADSFDQSTGAEVERGYWQVEFFLAPKLLLNRWSVPIAYPRPN